MKRIVTTLCAGVLLVAGGTLQAAPASSPADHYLTAQLAVVEVDDYSGLADGLAVVGTYGLPLPRLHPNLGFEAELTKSVFNPDQQVGPVDGEFDYFTVAGYALFTLPLNGRFTLRGRGGLLYENWEYRANNWKSSDSEVGISLGGGVLYNYQPDMKLIAEMTIIENDILHFSAGAQFQF